MECLHKLDRLGHDGFNKAFKKGEYGFLYTVQPPEILEDGIIVYIERCTKCDYEKRTKVTPSLHQKHKRVYEIIETGEIIEDKNKIPLHTWYKPKLISVGESFLVHNHGNYGSHPVSRKHKGE